MPDSSAEQCIAIIHDMERMIADGRSVFRDQQSCVIHRETFQNKLRQLSSSLPGAVRTATEYVSSIKTIRQQAEQDCTAQLRDAGQRSEQLMSDAQQAAEQTRRRAEAESEALLAKSRADAQAAIDSAQAEANRILAEAQQQAQQMLQRENILRRARVEASELRDTTQMEMDALRKQVFDYLDCVTAGFDRHLSEMLTNLRRERANLNNMR